MRANQIITKDLGKLAWKVEFAARWSAFDIRFEAYGKDIMDSVKVNDWVSDEILDFPHPHHIKYEMFLDKGGKKISKSLGNVVTSQKWLGIWYIKINSTFTLQKNYRCKRTWI